MIKEQSKHKRVPKVSFARDIKPLFRAVDISHMKAHGIKLDDYTFMSDADNADKVLGTVSPHEDDPPAMPPGGPYWTAEGWIPAVNLIVADSYRPIATSDRFR